MIVAGQMQQTMYGIKPDQIQNGLLGGLGLARGVVNVDDDFAEPVGFRRIEQDDVGGAVAAEVAAVERADFLVADQRDFQGAPVAAQSFARPAHQPAQRLSRQFPAGLALRQPAG